MPALLQRIIPWLKTAISQDCILCAATLRSANVLCHPCLSSLPKNDADVPRCPQCALASDGGQTCGQCLRENPYFDRTTAAYRYAFPLDRLVQSVKFNANFALIDMLADELVAQIRQSEQRLPDCIMAMPLGKKRLAERGFNQAALLAGAVGQRLGVKVDVTGLQRSRETKPQSGLKWKARSKNVKDAFQCNAPAAGKRVALLDDVMTTGATLNEAAKTLKQHGAAEVSAWVIARADLRADATPYEEFGLHV